MAILRRCCCWKSVRSGSFASGIYTLIFYTVVVAVGAFHIDPAIENKLLLAFGLVALLLSGLCVMTSALLLVGLCADNRTLLLPWVVCVTATTVLDAFLSFYFILLETFDVNLGLLFITDIIVCIVNLYSLLCVISQYQEYLAGRGRPEDCLRIETTAEPRALKFHWPSFQVLNNGPVQDGEESQSTSNFLTVPDDQKNGCGRFAQTTCTGGRKKNANSVTFLIVEKHKENSSFIEYSPASSRSMETE